MPKLYRRPMSDLFECFGKHVLQPRREIFEKATGLSVTHSTSSGFLTRAESETAMVAARQHDVIGTHIDIVQPNNSLGRGRGNCRTNRRGARRGVGCGGSPLRHLQPTRSSAPPSAPPLAPPSTSSAPQQQRQQQQQKPASGPAASRRLPVAGRYPFRPRSWSW